MSRIFLDTNILVHTHDNSDPVKRARAKSVISGLEGTPMVPVISTQVLQEFYNVLTRKLGLSPAAGKDAIEQLAEIETISITRAIIYAATDIHSNASISFWDALIVSAAQAAGCQEIWTEDMSTGQKFGQLIIVNPL